MDPGASEVAEAQSPSWCVSLRADLNRQSRRVFSRGIKLISGSCNLREINLESEMVSSTGSRKILGSSGWQITLIWESSGETRSVVN